jgi:hypothetical protein
LFGGFGGSRRVSSSILDEGRRYPGEDNDIYQSRKTRQDDPNRRNCRLVRAVSQSTEKNGNLDKACGPLPINAAEIC